MDTLCTYHGFKSFKQAEVERSFNNNNLVLKGNLKIDSIVARLFINSYMIQKEF